MVRSCLKKEKGGVRGEERMLGREMVKSKRTVLIMRNLITKANCKYKGIKTLKL